MDTCLIKQIKNEPRVGHKIIAENTGNEARSVRLLIENNKSVFEAFGVLSFEMTKPLMLHFENEAITLFKKLRNGNLIKGKNAIKNI